MVLALGCLAACSIVPKDGPTPDEVRGSAVTSSAPTAERVAYSLVNIQGSNLAVINLSAEAAASGFGRLPPRASTKSGNVQISVGDIVSLTIFEATSGGLFIPTEAGSRAGNFVQVPGQQVDSAGYIDVPYAGSIKVAGITARAASAEIVKRLSSRAIEPQVVLTINERRGNDVSVLGEVNQPARFPLDPGGITLLGAIARAGGSRYPSYETVVSLQRGSVTYRSMLSSAIRNPRNNVGVISGDVVFLSREPKYVLIFGATPDALGTNTRKINFDNDNMTLAEGLAKASGLNTLRADPHSVFVFRMEPVSVLRELGVDTSGYTTSVVPTVYSLDLGTADGFFLMNRLNLRDKDVVVASEATSVDYLKFVNIVNQTFQLPTTVGAAIANGR